MPFMARAFLTVPFFALGLSACSPTVKVEAPDKPIEINLNIKIDQEVRVKVDRELDDAFANNPAIFGGAPTKTPAPKTQKAGERK